MIKKLILVAVSAISLYLTYIMIVNGINLERLNINVLSYNQIIEQGSSLDSKLKRINTLNTSEIVSARNNVETEKANFEAKRDSYAKLEANASEEEIAEANKKQEYLLDYLWIIIAELISSNNNYDYKSYSYNINELNLLKEAINK